MKNVRIDDILSVIDKYFPNETNESLSSRVGIIPEQFEKWAKSKSAPAREIYELIKSLVESDKSMSFIRDLTIEQFIKNCLYDLDGKFYSAKEWKWIWDKIINDHHNSGQPFENVLEKAEVEIKFDST